MHISEKYQRVAEADMCAYMEVILYLLLYVLNNLAVVFDLYIHIYIYTHTYIHIGMCVYIYRCVESARARARARLV